MNKNNDEGGYGDGFPWLVAPPENPLLSPPPSAEQVHQRLLPPLPLTRPAASNAAGGSPGTAAPLTIFYNGTVTTFDLPRDKAEAVIEWAEKTTSGGRLIERSVASAFTGGGRHVQHLAPPSFLLDKVGGDLPMARKRSLQRFFEKRKER